MALVFVLLLARLAAAQSGEATERVREANKRVQALLAADAPSGPEAEKLLDDKLTREMRLLFDTRDLARRALVDQWDRMKPAERDEVVDLVQKLTERSYVRSLRAHLKYRVEYPGEEPQQGAVLVRTVVKAERNGRPVDLALDYLAEKTAAGWRVLDVVTDGASMLKSYRSQFNKIITREGVAALLARMRRRLSEED